jgi:hypothetical protein
MAGALSSELRKRLEALKRSAPDGRLNVIVTLAPGTKAEGFSAAGLSIDQRIANPPLVMGTATPDAVLDVARVDGVELIEVDDGGVHTLE